jgi:very-short-patch-repair endonuclease
MLSAVLAARDFLSETAHRYQGDERDTMILSPVVARGLSRGARGFLERTPNLFNVALTRARAAIVVVGDKAECSTCDVEYLQNFVAYVHGLADQTATVAVPTPSMQLDYPPVARPELVSDWERKFYRSLAAAGIFSIPQYPVDQYLLDLALVTEGNRRLDIEIDGEAYHRDPWTGENVRRDQLRDMRLMEMGWDVRRFWVGEIRDDPQTCVRVVSEWLYR